MADPADIGSTWQLDTLQGCRLAIGRYPAFLYDASGGRATGAAGHSQHHLQFPAEQICIPPLHWRTTRVLGLPLPPGLRISMEPDLLEGSRDPFDGSMALRFEARFQFQLTLAGRVLYQAPDLQVKTQLSTSVIEGRRHRGEGRPLNASGEGRLVGVASIPRSGEAWLDRFLGLPDEALAVLNCRLSTIDG